MYPSKVPKLSDSFPITVSSALPNPPGYTPAATTQPPVCAPTTQPAFQTNCPAKLCTSLCQHACTCSFKYILVAMNDNCALSLSLSLSLSQVLQEIWARKKGGTLCSKTYLHGILNALDLGKRLKVR